MEQNFGRIGRNILSHNIKPTKNNKSNKKEQFYIYC